MESGVFPRSKDPNSLIFLKDLCPTDLSLVIRQRLQDDLTSCGEPLWRQERDAGGLNDLMLHLRGVYHMFIIKDNLVF